MNTSTEIEATALDTQMNRKEKTNIGFLLSGRLISLFGTQIYDFALALYVLKETGSAFSFALVAVLSMLPRIVLGPFAGVFADRVDRKKIVIWTDFICCLIVSLFFIISLGGTIHIPLIYATSFLLTCFNTFFDVALTSSIPNVVRDKSLMKISSLNNAISSLASVLGPVLGGIAYGIFDIKIFLLINAISFFVSAILELFIDFNINGVRELPEETSSPSIFQELKEGFLFIKTNTSIFLLFCSAIIINFAFCFGLTVPLPVIIVKTIKLSSSQLGTIEGFIAGGVIIGSIILSLLPEREKKHRLMFWGILGMSIVIFLTSLPGFINISALGKTGLFFYYIILMLILGFFNALVNLPINVLLQRLIPDNIRGKVMGTTTTMCMSMQPLGMLLSGLFMNYMAPYTLSLISGALLIIFTIIMFSNKDIKKL